jgi:hypothetical protein
MKVLWALLVSFGLASNLASADAVDANNSKMTDPGFRMACEAKVWRLYANLPKLDQQGSGAPGGKVVLGHEGSPVVVESNDERSANNGQGAILELKPSSNTYEAKFGVQRGRTRMVFNDNAEIRMYATKRKESDTIYLTADLVQTEDLPDGRIQVTRVLGRNEIRISAESKNEVNTGIENLDVANLELKLNLDFLHVKQAQVQELVTAGQLKEGSVTGVLIYCKPLQ